MPRFGHLANSVVARQARQTEAFRATPDPGFRSFFPPSPYPGVLPPSSRSLLPPLLLCLPPLIYFGPFRFIFIVLRFFVFSCPPGGFFAIRSL